MSRRTTMTRVRALRRKWALRGRCARGRPRASDGQVQRRATRARPRERRGDGRLAQRARVHQRARPAGHLDEPEVGVAGVAVEAIAQVAAPPAPRPPDTFAGGHEALVLPRIEEADEEHAARALRLPRLLHDLV